MPQTSLFYESVGGQDYLLAMVTPPTLDAAPKLLPRELIFVIDNSGSMAGTSIVQAKQSLLFALGRLRPGDKFNVVRFDDTLETLFDTAVDASSDNLAIAKHFVSRLDAEGGTEMLPALEAALKDATPEDTTRLRQVVFLTDGSVGNEAQLFEEIAKNRGRSRLFTVGIGSAPNSYFMTRAAELGRGTFTEIGSDAQVLERMSALFAKLEKPVMMGLKAEWPAGTSVEVWPDPLPDLYAGEPVVLSAKLRRARASFILPARSTASHGRRRSSSKMPCQARASPSSGRAARSPRWKPRPLPAPILTHSTRRSKRLRSSIIWCRAKPA